MAIMLALLLARWVRRPVNAFSASVRAVGAGHLERSITITGPPEFVQIARAVDGMRLRLVAEIARSTSTADQLAAANAELEAFTYSVSHDLRAPLRAIDGFSVALLEDAGDTLAEEPRRHVTRIRAATQRMAELIDDLLRLARVSRVAPTLTDVDVSALAESTVADIRHTAGGRPVVVTVEAGLHAVADPSLVRIVLENILGNAFKFTTGRPDAHIEVTGVGGCPHTLFTVSDNGAGFDQTYVAKLFAPFQRLHTEREFPGTGIGLATVARIIHRHGGEVTASGVVEHGARISFTLAPEIDREIAHAS
jgi:signal transduction histidine kinase